MQLFLFETNYVKAVLHGFTGCAVLSGQISLTANIGIPIEPGPICRDVLSPMCSIISRGHRPQTTKAPRSGGKWQSEMEYMGACAGRAF